MSRRYALDHWLPREFVARCGRLSLPTFLAEYADAYFLLVRLWDRYDNLTAGLMSRAAALLEADPSASSFTTADYGTTMARLKAGESLPPPEQTGAAVEVQAELCFIVPIRRSMARSDEPRITVGRSRQRSILLQHRSVSQLHAWFEFDAQGQLLLADANSKNKTLVRGERLGTDPVVVAPGTPIRFGAVRATVSSPAAVWGVLSGTAEASSLEGFESTSNEAS